VNVAREAETRALLLESERVREQLTTAVRELDTYVKALQDYLERRNKENE
jgi:Holliday junction resolvase RusA-like endonuclease